MEYVIQNVLSRPLYGGVQLLPENTVFGFECADGSALLSDNAQAIPFKIDRMGVEVSWNGMCFVSPKCEVLVQDCWEPVAALTLCDDGLEILDSFKCLSIVITPDEDVGEEA